MAIGLSEEHEALRESVTGWADRNIPVEVVRAAVGADSRERPPFWSGLAEQGLLGLHLPEEYGGSGFGLLETAVAVEALGERVAPGPYLPTVLASAVVHAADAKARADLLPGLADGTLTGAVALGGALTGPKAGGGALTGTKAGGGALTGTKAGGGALTGTKAGGGALTGTEAGGGALTGTRDGDGVLTVTGTVGSVLGAAVADVLVLPVDTGRGREWVALDAGAVTVTPVASLDLTRGVATVAADAVTVPSERVLDGLGATTVRDIAAVLLGAEAAGIASWCVRAAAAYAGVRVQFGRPIGQFQGVKHKASRMLVALEQARATVWDATRATGEEFGYAAAIAGVMAPDAAVSCAKDAIQIFGGIGYTFEHDAHLYFRRALTLRALLGASAEWADRVAGHALAGVTRAMEIDLPEDAEALRAGVRDEIARLAGLEGKEQKRALAAEGFVMPHLPRPWGRDASPLEQVLIHQELRAAKVKLPQMIIGAWVVPSVVAYGTPEQQERFLPSTLAGELIWCQLFSEPGAGSDLASLQMKAERAEGGWRLNGQKIWTSVAHVAEWGICIARTDTSRPKHDGITYFIVDMKAPGVTVRPLTEMTGENLFNEVFFDDVFVPDDLVVGEVNEGWRVARNTLSNERVSLSSGSGGTGSSVPDLLGLVSRLGRELTPAERLDLAAVVCEGHSINALSLRVTLKQIAGAEPGADASVRKFLSTSHAQHVAECAVTLVGTAATTAADMKLGDPGYWNRAVLATRAMTIYGGTTEVQLNIIAERLLGLPRDPEPGK